MKTKVCGTCKKDYPLSSEYFFIKKSKEQLATGKIAIYEGYRSDCKKCHAKKGEKRRIAKRCKEMGCAIEEYRENWKKQYSKTRTKHPELKHLSAHVRLTIGKWIDRGYKFITYEQFRIDVRRKSSENRRKYDYGNCDFVDEKIRTKRSNKRMIQTISDSYISNILGIPTKEAPKELIETKRLLIQIKREAGLTHSTRKSI